MTSQAMLLSDEDMADLAVYFESLPQASQSVADASLDRQGRGTVTGAAMSQTRRLHVSPVMGPTGRGNPAAKYPALNGAAC